MTPKRIAIQPPALTLGSANCWGFLALAVLLVLISAYTATANAGLQLAVGAGTGYDSNVAPDYSNTNVGLADSHYALEALVGWQSTLRPGRPQGLQLEASYWQKDQRWQTYSDYDSRLQSGLLRLSHYGSVFSSDLTAVAASANIAQQAYLHLYRLSPALGFSPSSQWYGRVQLDAMQKTYVQNSDRDSERVGARLQLYWFLRSSGLTLSAVAQTYQDRADDNQYSCTPPISHSAHL